MIQVVGLRETRAALVQVDAALGKELTRAGRRAATLIAVDARRRAPRRTGNLAASIRPRASANKAAVVAGNAKVPYAGVTEFGGTIPTRDRSRRRPARAQPYLYPAVRANEGRVAEEYAREVDQVVRKAGF